MALPSSLTYLASKFDSASSQIVRLETTGSRAVGANQVIQFNIPTNAICNMHTFSVTGKFEATGTSPRIPDSIMTLVNKVEILIGGQVVSGSSNNFGVVHNMLRKLAEETDDFASAHGGYEPQGNVAPDRVLTTDGAVSGTAESCTAAFKKWRTGFLTCEPRYISTSLLPQISVRITLASDNVLGAESASTNRDSKFSMSGIFATIECVNLQSPAMNAMIGGLISEQGYLPVVWKEHQVTRAANTGVVRATVASRSVSRILAAIRNKECDKQQVGQIENTAAVADDADAYQAAARLVCQTNCFGTQAPSGATAHLHKDTDLYMDASGVRYPQFQAKLLDWVNTLRDTGRYDDEMPKHSRPGPGLIENGAVLAARFSLAGSKSARLSSGIDSRSSSLIVTLNTQQSPSGGEDISQGVVFLAVECDNLLQIGNSRLISHIS